MPDDAEPARPVIPRPDDIHRSPRCHRIPLVRIDVARDEKRELPRPREETSQKVTHRLRHLTRRFVIYKEVHPSGGIPETEVDVAGGASPGLIGFCHERNRAPAEMGDLLCTMLVDGRSVSRLQCVVVMNVDFMLAGSGFSF